MGTKERINRTEPKKHSGKPGVITVNFFEMSHPTMCNHYLDRRRLRKLRLTKDKGHSII